MKTLPKATKSFLVLSLVAASSSCMTTYDAYGYPVQTVDPGAAAAAAVTAGAIGYAIGQNNDDNNYYYYRGGRRHYHGHHRGYRGPYHRGRR